MIKLYLYRNYGGFNDLNIKMGIKSEILHWFIHFFRMSTHTAVPRSASGSLSKSKQNRTTSSTYITFTPETVRVSPWIFLSSIHFSYYSLLLTIDKRKTSRFSTMDNLQSCSRLVILFHNGWIPYPQMKSTTPDIYRIRPVYFILKSKEKRTLKVTFKGLPSEQARCQRVCDCSSSRGR